MSNTDKDEKKIKPDPGTENTTDPQENMEGPISSLVQNIKESGDDNDSDSKEDADKKKERNT